MRYWTPAIQPVACCYTNCYILDIQNSIRQMPVQTPISCLLVTRPCYHPSRVLAISVLTHACIVTKHQPCNHRYNRLGTMNSMYSRYKLWAFPNTHCSNFGLLGCSSSLPPPLGLSDHPFLQHACIHRVYFSTSISTYKITHYHNPVTVSVISGPQLMPVCKFLLELYFTSDNGWLF
jgi:hypothetical protein